MLRFYRKPALSISAVKQIQEQAEKGLGIKLGEILTEWCFYLQTVSPLDGRELAILKWLLTETFEPLNFSEKPFLSHFPTQLEIGPRLNFETTWSSTAVAICHSCGLAKIIRIERSLRLGLRAILSGETIRDLLAPLHDRMTQVYYPQPLTSFDSGLKPKSVQTIPLIEQGIEALRTINRQLGLAMDEQDLAMYYELFVRQLQRNPTDVELFQLGQANSEHSRHPFFRGRLIIDGEPIPEESLMEIIKTPWKVNPGNSLIAFCDDSSAIVGARIRTLLPENPGQTSSLVLAEVDYHPTLTSETHNHPSAIDPYDGGGTGGGGRIRDNQVVGRGGLVGVAGAGYCVDNLHIPGCKLPWEDGWHHPSNMASPLEILIRASDGPSDYGNCFGEPVIYGFVRSFGLELPDGRRGWFKPIMYTVGAGQIDGRHLKKGKPEKGMLVVQVGGPAYRIGVGGGAASSMITGDNAEELDFQSVQRPAPEMEQRMNRLIRACIEMGENNPFVSIHDLGAGGDCNALPELVDPAGAIINLRTIPLGDKTLSVLEFWGNESQERNAFLIWPDRFEQIRAIAEREGVTCVIVGQITGDGWLIVHDENDGSTPVNLPLEKILGALPKKTFNLGRIPPKREPLQLPRNLTFQKGLEQVLRLLSVGSKRFLTTKVDRSVTGLVAQQQCLGPNQITLSDFAIIAQSHFGLTGVALSLGEQPMKGLISPKAMARMAVAEALLNMVGARITKIGDIKCSANWMLAAKLPGEGAWLYDAACALRDICLELGIAIDGGKDSLSMAAKTNTPDKKTEIVKAPGQLVIAPYAPMPDITCKATAEIKQAFIKTPTELLFLDLARGNNRLGGSALAQVFRKVGDDCPDVEDIPLLKRTFETVQELIEQKLILAVHDRSDGGLIVTLLEMAFSGNVGLRINMLTPNNNLFEAFFSEEVGLVIECPRHSLVPNILKERDIPFQMIGVATSEYNYQIIVNHNGQQVLDQSMIDLRRIWESTSTQIDRLQANPDCVAEEDKVNTIIFNPDFYYCSKRPKPTSEAVLSSSQKFKVAILRAAGSNGDREMASAFFLAGFEPWDVTTTDLLAGKISLDDFRGIAFVGGFTFADVLDAAKGWAGLIRFNKNLAEQFQRFYERPDTFSLGVCNGCQLMTLIGWVPFPGLPPEKQPRFIRNTSGRFESRFATVKVIPSKAIMLRGMDYSVLGVWIAHGEGRFYLPDEEIYASLMSQKLIALCFVDDSIRPTQTYPLNPNGSFQGITAICSPDGRHLAMMPHPERTFLPWQWPYWPHQWKKLSVSPWLRLFQNAREWCEKN